jgi:hypothetical protein
MRWFIFFILFVPAIAGYCNDSVYSKTHLKGYKKMFYKLAILHPSLNSPLERKLLQHYLIGSGESFLISAPEFERLKKSAFQLKEKSKAVAPEPTTIFYTERIVLDDDPYFGFGLGTITGIYNKESKELISFVDVYDFNKKKVGARKLKSEIITRMFRLIAPRSSKKFIVCYGDAAYYTAEN